MNTRVEHSFDDEALRGETTQQVAINLQQLRHSLRHDPEMFIQFFLGSQLTFPVPQFHLDSFYEMTHDSVDRFVQAIPRGHAKTMLAKLTAAYYLIFSEFRFVLYVSGSHDLVIPYVNDIANFFEHPNFIAVFGQVEWLIKQDGTGIYKFRIPLLNKVCILRGLGAGQRVRGINVDNERPQLAIVDDAEDDDTTETEQAFKKMMRWFYGAFLKCLDPVHNKVIVSGNLISHRSILYKLLQSERWRSILYAVIRENGQPLWPEVWPLERIKADFEEYREMGETARWMAEMMNFPIPEGGGLIRPEQITYRSERTPEEIEYGFITVDPAFSAEAWADNAAWGAHGWVAEEGIWQTLEERHQKGIDPTELFWASIELAERWGFQVIGVEAHSLQKALEHHWRHLQMMHGLHQYKFVPLSAENRSKVTRISAWASMLKTTPQRPAEWALTHGDFIITQQLLNFEPKRKDNDDDVIDMCAYGLQMIEYYLPDIMQKLPVFRPGTIKTLAQISEV